MAVTLASVVPFPRPRARPVALKVLTVNMHKGFTAFNRRFVLHELRDAIRAVSADVVFLQEVLGDHRGHASRVVRWPVAPQYEFLADSIWPEFAYGRNAAFPGGHHGNALLSKWPILHQRNHDVSTKGLERRGLLHCRLQVPGTATEVHVVCVHLGLRERHRAQQLDRLCALVEREVPEHAPLVVAGDFNDWRLRAHARLASCAGLREVFVEHSGQAAKTFPARLPLLRLDRIYVRGVSALRPLALPSRPWTHLSDHAPLAAEVVL
jgi:endonuclease/exonuclease/phosphatase family metal-dependent hydrolase